MKIHIEKDAAQLTHLLAEWITAYINDTLRKQETFTWALSGGDSPKQLYELLSRPPYVSDIPWARLHIFWGDERYVPFDDPRNNGKMAYESLLKHVPVPQSQIHYMKTDLPPEQSASDYEKLLHRYFDNDERSFDLALMGMGEDGHTLSLFPFDTALDEKELWVVSVFLSEQKMHRITLMPEVVNRASRIAFLITGENKAPTLHQVIQGPYQPDKFPVQLIHPQSGELHWFLDEAAAVML